MRPFARRAAFRARDVSWAAAPGPASAGGPQSTPGALSVLIEGVRKVPVARPPQVSAPPSPSSAEMSPGDLTGRPARCPPRDAADLLARAQALVGRSPEDLATQLGQRSDGSPVRTKGFVGGLLEDALGATGGSQATWDFPALRIELKSIPVDGLGKPRESTFVCTVSLLDAERAEWEGSWVQAKLSRVLWIPVRSEGSARTIGPPVLWSPTPEQASILADDFADILGRVAVGNIEGTTARIGRWLQLRPKAADGRVRTLAPATDGALLSTVPRGFYLRARFTGAILRDPSALPDAS